MALHALIGAAVGAVVGGAASAVTDVVKGESIDWKSVAAGAVGGAAAGGIASLTFGAGLLAGSAATQVGGMAGAGAVGGFSDQVTDNVLHDEEWHEDVGEATAVGAAVGGAAGVARVAAKPISNFLRSGGVRRVASSVANKGRALLRHPAARRLARKAGRSVAGRAARAVGRAGRHATRAVGRAGRRAGRAVARHPAARRVANNPAVRKVAGGGKKLWRGYMRALDKHPMRTKSLTSGGLSFTGDTIAQLTDDRPGIDWTRTAYRTAWGLAVSGPLGHKWFNYLDKVLPGNTAGAIAGKLALDQLLFAPAKSGAFFTGYRAIVEGQSPGEAVSGAWDDLTNAQPKSWMVWPAFNAMNFKYVPLNLRVPAGNAVGLGWSVLFSKIAFEGDESPSDAETGSGETDAAATLADAAATAAAEAAEAEGTTESADAEAEDLLSHLRSGYPASEAFSEHPALAGGPRERLSPEDEAFLTDAVRSGLARADGADDADGLPGGPVLTDHRSTPESGSGGSRTPFEPGRHGELDPGIVEQRATTGLAEVVTEAKKGKKKKR